MRRSMVMYQISPGQHIPPEIQQCAVTQQLGMPQIVSTPSKESSPNFLPGLLGVIIGCLIIGAFVIWYNNIFSWWPLWQEAFMLLIGASWLCVGGWILLTSVTYPRLRVFVCPAGLIYVKNKPEIIRWSQIEGLWKDQRTDSKAPSQCSYTIKRTDGAIFVLTNNLSMIESWGHRLEAEVTRRLLSRAIATYRAGTPLYFGDITIKPQGIGIKRQLLPWNEVKEIRVEEAQVSIYRQGEIAEWASLNLSDVPNVGALCGVVDSIKHDIALSQSPQMQAFEAGLPLSFGLLSISKQGIILNENEDAIAWSEIANIGVGEHEVMIRRKGKIWEWHALPIDMVSHVPLLKELIDYLMRERVS